MTGKRASRGRDGRSEAPVGLLRREEPAGPEAADLPQAERDAARRRAMERAALELSGEVGFAEMTVAALVERSGSNLDRFYRTYGDKGRCYAAAYAAGMEELVAGALVACATEPRWADGVRRALTWLAELVEAEPAVVKGLLGEARTVDAQTRQQRADASARLTDAIDRARRESTGSGHPPPPLTARFVLCGIEASVLRSLDRPGDAGPRGWLAGAVYIAVDLYLGPAAAREQVRLLEEP